MRMYPQENVSIGKHVLRIFLIESLASSWMLWAHLQLWRHFGSLSWSQNVGALIEINHSRALVLCAGLVYGTEATVLLSVIPWLLCSTCRFAEHQD